MKMNWVPTFYGWQCYWRGLRFTIRKYRRGDGRGFVYVLRVNGSALSSPPMAHVNLTAAKAEAAAVAR